MPIGPGYIHSKSRANPVDTRGGGNENTRLVFPGGVPKRPTGADCKSAGLRLRRFESFPLHHLRGLEAAGRRASSAGGGLLLKIQPPNCLRGGGFPLPPPLKHTSPRL